MGYLTTGSWYDPKPNQTPSKPTSCPDGQFLGRNGCESTRARTLSPLQTAILKSSTPITVVAETEHGTVVSHGISTPKILLISGAAVALIWVLKRRRK